jgi:hypothetical protein
VAVYMSAEPRMYGVSEVIPGMRATYDCLDGSTRKEGFQLGQVFVVWPKVCPSQLGHSSKDIGVRIAHHGRAGYSSALHLQ